jgi:hypothetical protein
MPTVTITEARLLLYQVEDKIEDHKRIIHNVIFGRDYYSIEETPNQPKINVEKAETVQIDTSEKKPITITDLVKIHKKLDELYLEKNKIQVAMTKFEATQTFTY